mmetsp:Transcript_18723/g.30354  ORF Transcript_18723/g.30354 Transcript_18723/m.30354 type:complete len:269 (+) Transcript_18723:14-820(+)
MYYDLIRHLCPREFRVSEVSKILTVFLLDELTGLPRKIFNTELFHRGVIDVYQWTAGNIIASQQICEISIQLLHSEHVFLWHLPLAVLAKYVEVLWYHMSTDEWWACCALEKFLKYPSIQIVSSRCSTQSQRHIASHFLFTFLKMSVKSKPWASKLAYGTGVWISNYSEHIISLVRILVKEPWRYVPCFRLDVPAERRKIPTQICRVPQLRPIPAPKKTMTPPPTLHRSATSFRDVYQFELRSSRTFVASGDTLIVTTISFVVAHNFT